MTSVQVLMYAQTLYYLVVSFAIIVLGVLFAVMAYHLTHIARHLRNVTNNLNDTSDDLKKRIEYIIERLASLPILGYFLKENETRASRNSNKQK